MNQIGHFKVWGVYVLGVYVLGGMCPWGKCPGGTCPGGFCPVTGEVIERRHKHTSACIMTTLVSEYINHVIYIMYCLIRINQSGCHARALSWYSYVKMFIKVTAVSVDP